MRLHHRTVRRIFDAVNQLFDVTQPGIRRLHEKIILALMDVFTDWDRYIETLHPDHCSRELHESLIRQAKGSVKAWRRYLAARLAQQQLASDSSPDGPPADNNTGA